MKDKEQSLVRTEDEGSPRLPTALDQGATAAQGGA